MRVSLTIGCKIKFTESVFTKYKGGKISEFIGERIIAGRIIEEGYASKTGYHFFTIFVYSSEGVGSKMVEVGSKIIRRGNVIYPKMEVISYPENYNELLIEKKLRKNKK